MNSPVQLAVTGLLVGMPESPNPGHRRVPPAIGVCRPLLARLTRGGVDLNKHLLNEVPVSNLRWRGRSQQWRWAFARVRDDSATELVLADGAARCVLAVQDEAGAGLDPLIEMDAFEGESLVLAATLRYAAIIAHLAALSRRPWRCTEVLQAGDQAELRGPNALRFGFTLFDVPDSGDAAARRATTGHVRLHRDDASRWHDSMGWRAPHPQLLAALPLALEIVVPAQMPFHRSELLAMRPGGAVLLGRNIGDGVACAVTLPGLAGHAHAALRGGRLVLRGPFTAGPPLRPQHTRKPDMPSPSNSSPQADGLSPQDGALQPPADSPHATANQAFLAELPVALDFHLGQVSVPLSDLQAELVEGSVFEIDQPLGAETVSVRAGGLELARGELVQVGDMIAVRITRLASRGPV